MAWVPKWRERVMMTEVRRRPARAVSLLGVAGGRGAREALPHC